MAYRANIIPGRNMAEMEELDEKLRKGCEEATKYNSNIYVYGKYGCGKTSVLKYFQMMAPEFFGVNESEVLFMKADDFIYEVIDGIRKDVVNSFRNKVNNSKVIIIDDIDRFENKDATQCEFRNILEKDKLVIISGLVKSDRLPLLEVIKKKIATFTSMEIEECLDENDDECID